MACTVVVTPAVDKARPRSIFLWLTGATSTRHPTRRRKYGSTATVFFLRFAVSGSRADVLSSACIDRRLNYGVYCRGESANTARTAGDADEKHS